LSIHRSPPKRNWSKFEAHGIGTRDNIVDVMACYPHQDTMDVASLEAVVALATSPTITLSPTTDITSSSDFDRDETTTPVVMVFVDVMVCHPHHNRNWIGIGIDRDR